ncbi:HupE/UreJ family protein [Bacteroidota bacterium]
MSLFSIYFKLGVGHITDLQAYDHILFLIVLCAVYHIKQWKKTLILITAFTLGHSLTLALAALKLLKINTAYIEFLIPVTILITSILNLFIRNFVVTPRLHLYKYILTGFFGLIHGLGFSNYLIQLLGEESNIVLPLFSFNIGIEAG